VREGRIRRLKFQKLVFSFHGNLPNPDKPDGIPPKDHIGHYTVVATPASKLGTTQILTHSITRIFGLHKVDPHTHTVTHTLCQNVTQLMPPLPPWLLPTVTLIHTHIALIITSVHSLSHLVKTQKTNAITRGQMLDYSILHASHPEKTAAITKAMPPTRLYQAVLVFLLVTSGGYPLES